MTWWLGLIFPLERKAKVFCTIAVVPTWISSLELEVSFTMIALVLSDYGRVCIAGMDPVSVLGPHNTEVIRKMVSV